MIVVVLGGVVAGCERIPGTEAHRIAKGQEVAAAVLLDPSSAQFRKSVLKSGPKAKDEKAEGPRWVVCGEINGKNRNGAYVGFSRFIADPEPEGMGAYLEPKTDTTDEDLDRAGKRCEQGAAGPFYSEAERELRAMQCDEAARLARELAEVASFNAAWSGLCEADEAPTEPQQTKAS